VGEPILMPEYECRVCGKTWNVHKHAISSCPKVAGGCGGPLKGVAHKPHKYHAEKTVYDGRTYDSKAEAGHAMALDMAVEAGKLVGWIPQVSIPLTKTSERGKTVRIRPDFLVIREVRPDGTFVGEFLDKKGVDTSGGKVKRKQFEDLYGVGIRLV